MFSVDLFSSRTPRVVSNNNNNNNNIMIIIIMIIHLFAGAFQGPQGRLTEHQLSMSMRITDLEGLE